MRKLDPTVYAVQTEPRYPEMDVAEEDDHLRAALDRLFAAWELPPENPLAGLVAPGDTVVIKPNWVLDHNDLGHPIESLVSHVSLIKHLAAAAGRAMNGSGTVVIGDAPIQLCDFDRLRHLTGVDWIIERLQREFPGLAVRVEDWRLTRMADTSLTTPLDFRKDSDEEVLAQYELVDLGAESFLEDIAEFADRFRVTQYPPNEMRSHHGPGKHAYLVRRCVLDADLVINLAKMKTHKRAGLTGALKNLVGINGHKEYLPHHIKGSYFDGGDFCCASNAFTRWYESVSDRFWGNLSSLSRANQLAYRLLMKALPRAARLSGGDGIRAASWSGNDTVWRMTLDLNHVLYFGHRTPGKVLSIVDGIIAGEGDGPLTPTPKPLGLLLGGENPATIDAVIAQIMGYNISRIPTVHNAFYDRRSQLSPLESTAAEVVYIHEDGIRQRLCRDDVPVNRFVKPTFWKRAESPLAATSGTTRAAT